MIPPDLLQSFQKLLVTNTAVRNMIRVTPRTAGRCAGPGAAPRSLSIPVNRMKPITPCQSLIAAIFAAGWLFAAPTGQAQELYQLQKHRSPRWASFENPTATKGAAAQRNRSAKGHAFDALKAGQSVVLMDYSGSGVIRRIWFTLSDRSPEMLRSLTLRMFWDGAKKPAVLVPFGDFFSISHGQTCPFESALFSNPEGRSFNCIIPMPFRRSARVVLSNESAKDLTAVDKVGKRARGVSWRAGR
jgi:Protein of unknown function (DUF2961)